MFKKLKIGKKLLIAFLTVTLLSSISGIVSLFLLWDSDVSYSDALVNYGFPQGQIGLLMSTINDSNAQVITTMATSDLDITQNAIKVREANSAKLDGYIAELGKTLVTPEEQAAYNEVVTNLPLLSDSVNRVFALSSQNKNEQAMDLYMSETMGIVEKIQSATQTMMDLNISQGTALSNQLTARSLFIIIAMGVLIAVALVASILIATFTARSISRPLSAFASRLEKLSEGDLTTPVMQVDTQDETGILGRAMQVLVVKLDAVVKELTDILGKMAKGDLDVSVVSTYGGDFAPLQTSTNQIIDSLNEIFSQINQSADQVSSGSDQVSSGAQALSQGATEQASAVEELAATINEISVNVKSNATNALDANRQISHTGNEVTDCNRQMEEMVGAMHLINESSQEISKIIKTIEDIAFQTNILALNAAVEAARAGAAGKGFAVVADEVRNLASKSAEAAKNTTSLIENSLKAVDQGTQLANDTQKSLQGVVAGTKEIIVSMEKITNASNDQANSISQVTQGVDQISAVVQTNSATSEESAAASEELSGQANMLKQYVSRFHLRGQASNSVQLSETLSYEPIDDHGQGHSKY